MFRFAARGAYMVALAAKLAGIPAGLAFFVGWPLPDHLPSRDELYRFATSGMSDQTVLDATAIALWLFWALFTVAVTLEAAAKIRGVQAPRVAVLAPVQGLAAALVTGVTAGMFATANLGPLVPALSPAQPPAVAVQQPPARMPLRAVAQYDTVTAPDAPTRTGTTVTLVIDDCGYTYNVVKGDSLWRIAKQCLGDAQRWPEIWQLNKDKYWPHVSGHTTFRDPDLIYPGWALTLPAGAKVPPGAEPVNPPDTNEPPVIATPTPDDGVFIPPGQPPTGTPSAPPNATANSPMTSTSQSPTPTASNNSDDVQTPASAPDGVDLPGGWITLGLGAGLAATAAAVWRRRRQRYQPTPITSPSLQEPDLLPPLAAMTRIRSTLRRGAADSVDDEAVPTPPTVREYRCAAVKPELPPVGPSGSQLAGAADLPLATGLGLTGDGALAAARGLLVATLASGSDDDPDAKGRVIVPAAALATLLGVSAVDLGHLDRLAVTNTTADAITLLEEEIIRRSRLIADAQAADVHTLRDTDLHTEPLPQLLLITELPDSAWTNRLITAVRLGHSVDIGAALIGDWPTGTTLTVAADGTTSSEQTPRLTVLDTTTTIDMLSLLREAHADTDTSTTKTTRERLQLSDDTHRNDPIAESITVSQCSEPAAHDTAPPSVPAPVGSRLPVTIRVLGRPAIINHDGQPATGLRKAAVELMVYLAVHRRGADLGDIMEALFPDATIRRASERLSTVVGNLRGVIRQVAAGTSGAEPDTKQKLEPVVNTGGRYHLDPTVVCVDWWTLTDHYARVATATNDQQRLAHLTAALDACSGALADGSDYDWIDTDREVVRRHRLKLHTHTASLLADSDPHHAWLLLEQACDIDPLSEQTARLAMRAAARTGDADAIRHRLKTLRDALDGHGLELRDDTPDLAGELLRQLHPPRPSE